MNEVLRQEILTHFSEPTDDLYLRLAIQSGMGATAPTPRDGEALFRNWLRQTKDVVCHDPEVRRLHGVLDHKRTELACVIGECLLQKYTGIPAGTIAILLMREGLAGYCATIWNQPA